MSSARKRLERESDTITGWRKLSAMSKIASLILQLILAIVLILYGIAGMLRKKDDPKVVLESLRKPFPLL